ncbi:MAG: single-stranded DNA-binding protein [Dehalococcoidia bacterium]|nr:single-stranded DNA-binding protein [Dehalococcoidia bacterium]
MVSLNKVMLIGNVGSDPEMRFTPSGSPVTSFRIATNRVYSTPDGERKQETDWFTVVAWNKLAEQCNQFLNKGKLVYVEGRLRTRSWDGTDGQKHFRTEVIASRVTFLDRAGTSGGMDDKPEDMESGDDGGELLPFSEPPSKSEY